jgi:hypothetical protein
MASIEIGITPSSEKTAKWTAPLLTPNSCFINLICTLTGGKEKYLSSKLTFSFTNIYSDQSSEQYFELILTKQRLLSLIKEVDFLKMFILNIMVIVLNVLMNSSTWVYYLNQIYSENNVEIKIQPCFTPTFEVHLSVIPSSSLTQ